MSKKIISFTTCLFFFSYILLFPTLARGSEKVATVKQGERAPFTGTLFNTEAAARLLADLETNKKWCEIEADRKLGIQKTEMQLKIDILQASRDSLQIRHDEIIKIKNGQIDYLEKKLTKPRVPNELWFVIGTIAGASLAIGAGYSMSQLSNR
tara:strand:+ start:19754 stop:20212 length:459 start_codon:yes stop_codon:yes gene_type:complete